MKRGPRPKSPQIAGQKSIFHDQFVESLDPDDVGLKKSVKCAGRAVNFVDNDPRRLFVFGEYLDDYLRSNKLKAGFVVRNAIRSVDHSAFEANAKFGGARPYHPMTLTGLIVYGMTIGIDSLRELENLAKVNLECKWVCGGITPDHSTIGKFIVKNDHLINGSFFESVNREILKRAKGKASSLSGDGTVIQALASRYGNLSAEAAREFADAVRAEAEALDDDSDEKAALEKKAENAEKAAEIAEQRADTRKEQGKNADGKVVAPSDPDAVIQKQKDGTFAAGYKPSVLANDQRIVVAAEVHPSSETAVVESMIEQAERVSGEKVEELKLDAGYFNSTVLELAEDRDINLLCPEGRTKNNESWEKQSKDKFGKNEFTYDEGDDTYTCPAGRLLKRDHSYGGNKRNRAYVRYKSVSCEGCPLMEKCLRGKAERTIKRYDIDKQKEKQRKHMKEAESRDKYCKRQAEVEPVFSSIKGEGKFTRFRRRGTLGANVEFKLHVLGHNFRRLIKIMESSGGDFVHDFARHTRSLLIELAKILSDPPKSRFWTKYSA